MSGRENWFSWEPRPKGVEKTSSCPFRKVYVVMNERKCRACDSDDLLESPQFLGLSLVNSDCRPSPINQPIYQCTRCGLVQKVVTKQVASALNLIYQSYRAYEHGLEPLVFGGDSLGTRADAICDEIEAAIDLPISGQLLDVGCSDGAFLKAFKAKQPNWRLAGFDLNPESRLGIEAICGPERFFQDRIDDISERFDLIVFNYVLEHVDKINELLTAAVARLRPHGKVAIVVPDLNRNPFDLIIADHLSHFDLASIKVQLQMFESVECREFLDKELLILVSRFSVGREISISPGLRSARSLGDLVEKLLFARDQAIELAIKHRGNFAIFGTATAGTWLSQELKDIDHLFVDEDFRKYGRKYSKRDVVHPSEISKDGLIFLPMPQHVANRIMARLSRVTAAKLVVAST